MISPPERGRTLASLSGTPTIDGMTMPRGLLIGDFLSYFASKLIPGFFGLASVPVFVRLIGLEEYGRLSLLLPILMALGAAGSGWLGQGILRFQPLPNDRTETKFAFNRAVLIGTVYSVLIL